MIMTRLAAVYLCMHLFAAAIHRLDRLTSGLLLLSAHVATAQRYSRAIQDRDVKKEYVCRVLGEFPEWVVGVVPLVAVWFTSFCVFVCVCVCLCVCCERKMWGIPANVQLYIIMWLRILFLQPYPFSTVSVTLCLTR
eukprot:Opistho-2@78134